MRQTLLKKTQEVRRAPNPYSRQQKRRVFCARQSSLSRRGAAIPGLDDQLSVYGITLAVRVTKGSHFFFDCIGKHMTRMSDLMSRLFKG
jgi:hypothetical protein